MSKDLSPSVKKLLPITPSCLHLGRALAGAAVLLALAACDDPQKRAVGTVGHVRGFAGMVAADEPRAAQMGRDALSAGGSAADAAVAMYFTMAVTLPSTASLGGGGSCVVHDPAKKKTEILEFPAIASRVSGQIATGVPTNPRGMFALHAKYGILRFESLLVEAERLARSGVPVSRALANDLARALPILARDPALRAIFMRPDGSVLREGEILAQPQLAAVIANLRRSTGDFYSGIQARELVKSVQAAGGSLTLDDLAEARPAWRQPLTVKVGDEIANFAPPPSVGSTVAAEMVGMLWPRWSDAAEDERPHLLAEASARAFADRARWMRPNGWSEADPADLVSTGHLDAMMADYAKDRHVAVTGPTTAPNDFPLSAAFVVLDGKGMAVACNVTTYGLFGAGRMARESGIVLAGAPGPNGPPALTTMISVNPNSNEIHFVGAASGGGTAPSALVQAFLMAAAEDKPLDKALAAPRLVHPATPDVVFAEAAPNALDTAPLQRRGHQINVVTMPSRVEALHCPEGQKNEDSCEAATDPRGFGLATRTGTR